ncbi:MULTISPECIES: TIGR02444 family protein [unclassified Thioalkalivibrio]|uniref:TIGR02444 family protein n=1 Tax=unclassified Thioalkalivibrio TaxID=2621013 RepID=UPI00035C3CD1|nr:MULTISPECIES: TIGR02444 family protein [unclassified Thioalkalivibrio]
MPEAARPHDFDSFWDFALRTWASAPGRERLLHWQDRHDVDVILALFALWYPGGVHTHDWEALMQATASWRARTTSRVRALRRRLKPNGPDERQRQALYDAVKGLEIACERTAAMRLCQHARTLGNPAAPPDLTRRLRLLFPALPVAEIRDGIPELTQAGCT